MVANVEAEDGPRMWKKLRGLRLTRDLVLFLAGLGGVAHETFNTTVERPILLGVFCLMMGLPVVLNADERRQFFSWLQEKNKNGNGKKNGSTSGQGDDGS